MQSITLTDDRINELIGIPVYNTLGKRLGEVTDIAISKTARLKSVACSNGTQYTRGELLALNDIAIIKIPRQANAKANSATKRTKQKITANDIQTVTETAERTYPLRRRYGDFSFLLGKTVDKNITNFYNEIMLRKGSTVTHDALKQAKISGKLIELCLHAK